MGTQIRIIFSRIAKYLLVFARWLLFGSVMGATGGLIGAFFAHSISFVTSVRGQYPAVLYALPLGGLVSVAIYRALRVSSVGTNRVLESVRDDRKVPAQLAPAIFTGTVISHLFGASAGREGAALQLGGSVASLLGRLFRLDKNDSHILTLCGMASFFCALFGTPLGAMVFALEVANVGSVCLAAIFPTAVSSVAAFGVAKALGVGAERFLIPDLELFDLSVMWRAAVVAMVCAIVSMLFCRSLHLSEKLFSKYLKNPYLRIAVGGAVLIALTLAVGTTDYNGGGMNIIAGIFEGDLVGWEAFLLKIVFTCVTVAAGYKGGEIVPTFFIGAALGCALSSPLGMDPAFGAALGMTAMFCGVTNCPLASMFLAIEMFSGRSETYFALAVALAFLLSGSASLYSSQKLAFSKLFDAKKAD